MGLLRRFKDLFDLTLALAVTPCAEQISHSVKLKNLLKLHGIRPLQDAVQWNIKDWMRRPAPCMSICRFDVFCRGCLHSKCLRRPLAAGSVRFVPSKSPHKLHYWLYR